MYVACRSSDWRARSYASSYAVGVTGCLLHVPKGTPAARAAVIKLCRGLWGEIRLVIPARQA
jgi:hypothetical protein